MRTLVVTLALSVAAALSLPGSANAAGYPPDVEACIRPQQMDAHAIEDCLDQLVRSSNAGLDREYAAAVAGLDPESGRLLAASQDAFNAWWRLEVAAAHGPWRRQSDAAARQIAAMANAITICRERRDELHRLYVDR